MVLGSFMMIVLLAFVLGSEDSHIPTFGLLLYPRKAYST